MIQNRSNWAKLILILAPFLFACGNQKESGYSDLLKEKPIKNRITSSLPIEYVFHRIDDSACVMYYRLDAKDFLSKLDSVGKPQVNYSLHFQFTPNQFGGKTYFSKEINQVFADTAQLFDSIHFSLPDVKTAFYEIQLIDENKHLVRTISAFWEREYDIIPEDFLLINPSNQAIYTQSFFNAPVLLESNKTNEILRLETFTQSNRIATRMYQMKDNPMYAEPETPEVKFGTLEELNLLINDFPREAYYRIRERADDWRPSFTCTKIVELPEQNIAPLIYLLQEDESISFSTWLKFWSQASMNDTRKAEKLIKEFNRRVEYANDHFSSHKIGWKTDRGMMYILLGPPDRITDDLRSEVWSYGFTSSISREFVFARNPNGLHYKDFILDRNLGYREVHLGAVERWKNGWVKFGWDGNQ